MNTDQIRDQLLLRLTQLHQRAERCDSDASHRQVPLSADFAEQANERENDEVLEAISDQSTLEGLQIRAALEQLDQDRYGLCVECDSAISPERLTAIPYAVRCIDCA